MLAKEKHGIMQKMFTCTFVKMSYYAWICFPLQFRKKDEEVRRIVCHESKQERIGRKFLQKSY